MENIITFGVSPRDFTKRHVPHIMARALNSLRDLSIHDQFRKQGVIDARLRRQDDLAILLPRNFGSEDLFVVDGLLYDANEARVGMVIALCLGKPSSWPFSIGHELAHTFFHEVHFDRYSGISSRILSSLIDRQLEEDFCELFAWYWLITRGNYGPLIRLINARWGHLLWPRKPVPETVQISLPLLQ